MWGRGGGLFAFDAQMSGNLRTIPIWYPVGGGKETKNKNVKILGMGPQQKQIKSRLTAYPLLSAHAHWFQAHRQLLFAGNESSLLFAAIGKAEPLISTAAHQ